MTTIPLRAMSAGEILDGGFQVYRRHFAVMYLVSLLAAAPIAVWGTATSGLRSGTGATTTALLATLLLIIAIPFLNSLVYAALVELSDRSIMGQEVSAGTGLRLGLPRVASMIGLMLLVGALIMIPAMFMGVLVPLFAARGGGGMVMVLFTLVLVGLILVAFAIVPPVLFLAVPALVKERLGSSPALKRGLFLSKGARGRLWLLSVLVYIIAMLPALATTIFTIVLVGARNAAMGQPGTLGPLGQVMLLVVNCAMGALTAPFTVGCMVMAYYDRRIRVEALDVELASAELVNAG